MEEINQKVQGNWMKTFAEEINCEGSREFPHSDLIFDENMYLTVSKMQSTMLRLFK